jgi:hypothetical protein
MELDKKEKKDLFFISAISAFVAGLCCFTPVVLVLVGLGLGLFGISFAPGDTEFASNLSDILYGQYKWLFRSAGLVALMGGMVVYFRRRGICSIDQVKLKRNKIINITLLVLISAVAVYLVWLYVIVEYAGIFLNIWG